MPRTPIIVGNWKMHTLRAEALALVRAVCESTDDVAGVEKIVCPPYVFLHDAKLALAGSSIAVGAQNAYWEETGAFTGEISITQIAETATHVILGHSERRQYFGETDETVNRRIHAALAHSVIPIMCVGETMHERQAGETAAVLVRQICGGLAGVDVGPSLIIAYEPVWAIGTGLAADGFIAQEAIVLIRNTVRDLVGAVADEIRILYGGSVTPDNIGEYMAQPDLDGGLVGSASLKAESYAALVRGVAAANAGV